MMAEDGHSTAIELGETSSRDQRRRSEKGKSPVMEAPLIGNGKRSYEVKPTSVGVSGMKRGFSVLDLIMRVAATIAVLAAAIAMGTTEQTLPFFTQFFQFQAQYTDLPTFNYFVVANAISSAYLVLSLPFSIVSIIRPLAKAPRLVLIGVDAVALALTMSGAGSSAAIVYLAHKGNANANWIAICQQFDSFCERTSGAVVASFVGVVLFMLLIILSAVALKSH